MKNIYILIALSLAVTTSNAKPMMDGQVPSLGKVSFTVAIKRQQCNVEVGNPVQANRTVNLGQLPNRIGATSPLIPINFKFSGCQGFKSIQKIMFSKDLPNSGQSSGNRDFITTKNPKVRFYLYDDVAATRPFKEIDFGKQPPSLDQQPVEIHTVCYARAEIHANGSDSTPPGADTYTGRAEFTITYN